MAKSKKSAFKIKPLGDRVLIEAMTREEKTQFGILLPDTMNKERPEQGTVMAVGPGKSGKDGTVHKMSVKKGDVILFTKYGPSEVKINGKEYLVAKEDDILAVLE